MSNWICGFEKLKLNFDVMYENDIWVKGVKYFVILCYSLDDLDIILNKMIGKCGKVYLESFGMSFVVGGMFNLRYRKYLVFMLR